MSDQTVAEISTWQHTTLTRDVRAPGRIWLCNSSKRAAKDPRLRPRGHWDRLHINDILKSRTYHKGNTLHLQHKYQSITAVGRNKFWQSTLWQLLSGERVTQREAQNAEQWVQLTSQQGFCNAPLFQFQSAARYTAHLLPAPRIRSIIMHIQTIWR